LGIRDEEPDIGISQYSMINTEYSIFKFIKAGYINLNHNKFVKLVLIRLIRGKKDDREIRITLSDY